LPDLRKNLEALAKMSEGGDTISALEENLELLEPAFADWDNEEDAVYEDVAMLARNNMGVNAAPVLTSFVTSAMEKASYRILDDGSYYGEIEECQGVWANEKTLEECRKVLQEILEEWLVLKLRDHDKLPLLNGVDLNKLVGGA